MNRIVTIIIAGLFTMSLSTKGQILTPQAEISVYTLGPFQAELYSAFGHNAIRVSDPFNKLDLIYNYGIYDFEQPNFYLNFVKGKPYYLLGVQHYEPFINVGIHENRKIVQQVLNLTPEEKQELFDFLQWNAKPENRDYYYNYVYDNCATRIRDVVDSLFTQVQYDYSYVVEGVTIRDIMDMYLQEQAWGDLGIDFCLGTDIDKVASGYQYMYMPDFIEKAFAGAYVTVGSKTKPLVKETNIIYEPIPTVDSKKGFKPFLFFLFLFIVIALVSYKDLKKKKRTNWLDIMLFSIVGILGWLLFYLWFFTSHISEYNFNLLWAIPLHFPIALFLISKKKSKFIQYYFLSTAVLLLVLLLFWGFWPQNMHESLIPFILALLLRAILVYLFQKDPKGNWKLPFLKK